MADCGHCLFRGGSCLGRIDNRAHGRGQSDSIADHDIGFPELPRSRVDRDPSASTRELLKLGTKVSQATVAKYLVRRIGTPSPNWRSFLRNEAIGIAAIDMFVAVWAWFRLLYVMIILLTVAKSLCGSMSRSIPRQRGFRSR